MISEKFFIRSILSNSVRIFNNTAPKSKIFPNQNINLAFLLKNSFSTTNNMNSAQRKRFLPKADISMKNSVWYILSGFVIMVGASYAAVPLYKLFCESTGYDANTNFRDLGIENLKNKLMSMKKVDDRNIKVKFVASTSADLLWEFEPSQEEITLTPGETALAFFRAKNLSEKSIIGIATYTILPYEAALYFNKIQCFCFEEQRLDPKEEVDMPVFFYIDEQFADDPKLEEVEQICLSYTFFESKGSNDLEQMPQLAKPFPTLSKN